jgi:hypothetical protein
VECNDRILEIPSKLKPPIDVMEKSSKEALKRNILAFLKRADLGSVLVFKLIETACATQFKVGYILSLPLSYF